MFLKSTGFNCFAKIMGENYVFVAKVVLALTLQAILKIFQMNMELFC